MSDTKPANQGAVTSMVDTDLVMCVVNGSYHPISFSNLMAAIKGGIQIGGRNLIKNSANSLTSLGSSRYYNLAEPIIESDSGKQFTLSFRYEYSGVSTGGTLQSRRFYLYLMIGGKEFACLFMLPENSNNLSGEGLAKSTITIPAFSGTVSQIRAMIQFPSGTVKMYNFKMERGNVATDWTPAPEDIASGTWGGG